MYQGEFHLNRVPNLPDDAYWKALEASLKIRTEEQRAAKAYFDGAQRVKDEYVRRLQSIIGAQNLDKYSEFRRDHRRKLRSVRLKGILTKQSLQKSAIARRPFVEQSRGFLTSLGIDVNAVRGLQRDVQTRLERLEDNTLGKGEIVPARPGRKAKNKDFSPPFNGWYAFLTHYAAKEDPTDILHFPDQFNPYWVSADPQNGNLHAYSFIGVEDASNWDKVVVRIGASVVQWFQVPSAGQVRVSVTADLINVGYSGWVIDEAGWSELYLRHRGRIVVRVLAPTVSPTVILTPLFNHKDTDESSHDFNDQLWGTNVKWGPVDIGQFPKGTWVAVEAGVRHKHNFVSNDCEIHSGMATSVTITKLGLSAAS